MGMEKGFRLSKVASAVLLAFAAPAAIQLSYAGAGWGDSMLFSGQPIKRPTYFAHTPSGLRDASACFDRATGVPATPSANGACDSGTALAKFKDVLPMLGLPGGTGNYISVAAPDTTTYPGTHYYELVVMESKSIQMHSDLPATTLRTYVQVDPIATDSVGVSRSTPATYLGLQFNSQAIPLVNADGSAVMISRPDRAGGFVQRQAYGWDKPTYLGSTIVALQGTPTRITLYNGLPAGHGVTNADGSFTRNGDLPIPVDRSNPGAGDGPVSLGTTHGVLASSAVLGPYGPTTLPDGTVSPYNVDKTVPPVAVQDFLQHTQNRAELHLHGGDNPWQSDGHPHQWIAPAADELKCKDPSSPYFTGAPTNSDPTYCRGPIAYNVPDMPDPGPGAMTYFWPNGQSGRLMMFHDHATGLTRLNAYLGEAAGYVLADPQELDMITSVLTATNGSAGILDVAGIPLVIQDKTFVPKDIDQQDARWDTVHWGSYGDLWYPHVYEPNQDPDSIDGTNPVGRWDWGAYFWPVFPSLYAMPTGVWGDETLTPEAWMDTPIVNGAAYPTMAVEPKTYRFRMLSVANDRFFNLGLYIAADKTTPVDGITGQTLTDTALATNGVVSFSRKCDGSDPAVPPADCTEVSMVPFDTSRAANPALVQFPTNTGPNGTGWGTPDGRFGGVPDPATKGPDIVQIGNEAGLLAQPLVIPSTITNYEYNKRSVTVLSVLERGLWIATAERADVLIDFSQYAGKTLILYNDSPAPVPAGDPRLDFFTGMGDMTPFGGAPNPKPGFGPNTRTVMQFVVSGAPAVTIANATAANPGTLRDNVNNPYLGFAGAQISIASAVTVSQLGRWNIAGNGQIHTVKLVDATGADVPSASVAITMTAASAGGFQYASLAAPVTLQPGTYYLVSSEDTTAATGDAFYDLNTVVTTGAAASVTNAIWLSGPGTNVAAAQPTWNVIGGAGNSYGPVDFKYNVAGTVTANPLDVNALKAAMASTYAATQPKPVVPQLAYNAPFIGLTTTDTLARIYTGSIYLNRYQPITFTTPVDMNYTVAPTCNSVATCNTALATIRSTQDPVLPATMKGLKHAAAGSSVSAYVENKAIQELFDPDFGRMNATLGVELPFTSSLTQTTIPLAYVDPATETVKDGETQFWKITHNGVDTHPVHFHMLNVQVINRVGWDGTLKPPLGDEIGWKETVRMHPLEDIIVAVRAKTNPMPFGLPYSSRMDAPHLPAGSTHGFTQVDPATGNPAARSNKLENYKYEYVWHCHILGHEENDFMRPFILDPGITLSPAPSGVAASLASNTATINWTDPTAVVVPATGQTFNQVNAGIMDSNLVGTAMVNRQEIGFRVERGTGANPASFAPAGTTKTINVLTNPINTLANATSFTDPSVPGPVNATAPASVTVGAVTPTQVTLSWSAGTNVASYNVLRAPVTGGVVGTYAQVGTTAATTFTDATVVANSTYSYQIEAVAAPTTYTYRVVAVNAAGDQPSANTAQVIQAAGANASSAPVSAITPPAAPSFPTAGVVDNFNRANANNLGANWQQQALLGLAELRVNANQAVSVNVPLITTNVAYWNTAFGARQAAAFTLANATVNGDALFLKASGAFANGRYANAIRVLYNNGSVTVATTTNSGTSYTTAGTVSTAGALVNGNRLTAAVTETGLVHVWKTVGAVNTFLGSVQLPNNALWTTGGGRIGMELPTNARVDNFVGGAY